MIVQLFMIQKKAFSDGIRQIRYILIFICTIITKRCMEGIALDIVGCYNIIGLHMFHLQSNPNSPQSCPGGVLITGSGLYVSCITKLIFDIVRGD